MSGYKPGLVEIAQYFAGRANRLDDEAKLQKIFDNPADRGDAKEVILQGFLEDHLPKRCAIIRGGFIFDSFGNKSGQVDLLVTSEFTLQFNQTVGKRETKSFNCVEGTIAAISVNSKLDKENLCKAIDNLATLPRAKEYFMNPYDQMTDELVKQTPFKIIFAYSGVDLTAFMRYLKEHIKTRKLSIEQAPDLIIVNNQYYVAKKQEGHFSRTIGDTSATGSYLYAWGTNYIGGLALLLMVSTIQRLSNLGSLVMLNFLNYQEQIRLSVINDFKAELLDAKELFADE
ncbi:DUF6602 domain-containing protein [Candidatus Nitrososphaera sp. FF02]|uniref:DUF6602 domain-containing protein n=1 Tax=Candidatus Nitrososphaera sp. FF02 TaxID=3398226 RepID=UPI0039E80664